MTVVVIIVGGCRGEVGGCVWPGLVSAVALRPLGFLVGWFAHRKETGQSLPLRSRFDFVRRFKTVIELDVELRGDVSCFDVEDQGNVSCM